MQALRRLKASLHEIRRYRTAGVVTAIRGPLIAARIPRTALGDICSIALPDGTSVAATVVAFEEDRVNLAPHEPVPGVLPGAVILNAGLGPKLRIPSEPIGRTLDALGNPLDWRGDEFERIELISERRSPPPLSRCPITSPLHTGVRIIDALCPIGYGQRVGLFAGAGVGKSTLLGMIARNADVDVSVVALVGERGREVNDFLKDSLGEAGRARSVVVVSTSDETAIRRQMAVSTATAIAEHFRDSGKRVLLLVDSLTRVARAVRDVSLATGEIPVRQGYTASVYTYLPRLLERAGTSCTGSITGIYAMLTNGGEEPDPLSEEVKSLLDGHLVLDAQLAIEGLRPAIDPLASISRLVQKLKGPNELACIASIKRMINRARRDRDVVLLGGTPDPELRAALELEPRLIALLSQPALERVKPDSGGALDKLAQEFEHRISEYSSVGAAGAEPLENPEGD